jgi:endonuclease/exonuclease/phosphatase family metal-dependent hydrolase
MKRTLPVILALVVALSTLSWPVSAADGKPPRRSSPPGQLQIATVNARQNKILGLKRFEALLELAKAFRFRPSAFNGGARGAVIAPDVAVISEFRETNVEVFARLLRQKFDLPYEIVGPSDVQAAFIVNTEAITLQGEVGLIDDVCMNDETSDIPRLRREYPIARFTENATGASFSIVGVHLSRDYSSTGENDCLVRNVTEIRDRLEDEPGATFLAGDFNFRSVELPYECDPNEESPAARWWNTLVSPDNGGRPYVDAVRQAQRARGETMANQWTYQHPSGVMSCTGQITVRKSRIDYIFASGTLVAEAYADDPGWAGSASYKYSDHRYVLGRFIVTGPPRPERPVATADERGLIHLDWQTGTGVTGWIVYRARVGEDYSELVRLGPKALAYDDSATEHGTTYRYALAPLGADGGQGLESGGSFAEADARGPRVTSVTPSRGAVKVSPHTKIRVTFDEWVDANSVGPNTITLYRGGNALRGRLIRRGGFVLKFDPARRLRKGKTFTIVVRPVADVLGNEGPLFKSQFRTVEPPKKKRRHNRR